jgi:hypothetical protein
VVARCLAGRPEDRYQDAAQLAAELESCRELRRVERDLPASNVLARLTLGRPFLATAVLLLLPHLLGSVVNITYNTQQIVQPELNAAQRAVFAQTVLWYNVLVYPVCIVLLLRPVVLVFRTWRKLSRPGPIAPAEVDEARRRALRLPVWDIVLACVGWLPGGLIFPLVLHLASGNPGARVYWHFLFSFTISGLIALTYSTIAAEFIVVRILYPRLWLDARQLRSTARGELAREEGRLAVLQFLAVLIPLAGASLLLSVGGEHLLDLSFRVLVTALLALGMVGLGVAILAAKEVRHAVDALTGHR